MIHASLCAIVLLMPSADAPVPPHVAKYLQRCAQAQAAAIKATEQQLQRLREGPAPLVRLPLPPAKDDLGTLDESAVASRAGRSLIVLEVVDEHNAIVRAWHLPADARDGDDPTFVDLWVQGIDTAKFAAGSSATLPQVFHVTGNKLFDTTCGKRSLPLLEPIDIEPFRGPR